jgi:hypothetical protein
MNISSGDLVLIHIFDDVDAKLSSRLGVVINVGGKYTSKTYCADGPGRGVVNVLFIHHVWDRFCTWDLYESQCTKIE